MALTILLGLAILSVANYGNTFEFSGLDPSVQSKTQLKPTIKPVSSFTNQPRQGDQIKPAFAGFKNIAAKPYGLPFDSFKPSYQPYQPGPFRTNYQPFGPYPGYPGPVVYPGQGSYPGPAAYPAPPHHFDDSNQRPFGFQPFPGSAQQSFNPFKFGSAKKFNKNLPGLAEINLPGKYFQEHQFGAYHGPEFSSAIVPAEHNLKLSKPKDTLLGKPAVPALPELGFPKQNVYGFAPPPPSFRYPLPSFPPNQPFFNTVPSVATSPTTAASPVTAGFDQKFDFGSAAVTTAAAPTSSQDESATAQQSSEVTGEPSSVTPAADPQPTGPSQEEATAAGVEVATNNEVPAAAADDTAAKEQSEQSNPTTEATEPSAAQENDTQTSAEKFNPVVVEELKETSTSAATAAGGEPADPAAGKSGEIKEIFQGIKPTEPAAAVNVPGLPNELYSPVGDVPVSIQPYLGASGYPFNFGQTADFPAQPSFFANYEAPKFTEEELKQFEANFRNGNLQPFQFVGSSDAEVKIAGDAAAGVIVSTESGVSAISSSTPSSSEEKVQSGAPPADAAVEEKKEAGQSESRNSPAEEAPKKSNTVQIIQDDPFNGQFPLLFDSSNAAAAASPLDTYRFYSHPSVSALSTQASLASYSPEDAFANFGTQFRQGYLVEGSSSLTPAVTKTVVHTSQIPISISSADHPLHSQVFRFSQSFVPYPEVVASNGVGAPAFRSFEAQPSSSTEVAPVAVGGSDVSSSTAAAVADTVVSSTTETVAAAETGSSTETST